MTIGWFILVFLFLGCRADPAIELAALKQLFSSTNGERWYNNTGWTSNDRCSFYGITCTNDSVTAIHLETNGLSGPLPDIFRQLPSLRTLSLTENALQGFIPDSVWQHTTIRRLDVSSNLLIGTIPSYIVQMKSLRSLALAYVSIGPLFANSFLGELCDLSLLTQLNTAWFPYNMLEGPLPPLPSTLLFIDFHQNRFSGPIPDSLYNCTQLLSLNLETNMLNGTLSEAIGNLQSVSWIDLQYNQLSGPLPQSLGTLSNLQTLTLSGNRFTGMIPESLWQAPSIQTIDLSDNALVGPISESIRSSTSLQILTLDINDLSGNIPILPQSLYSLTLDLTNIGGTMDNITLNEGLIFFTADSTQLHGEIPQSVANLTQLKLFSVSGCHLSGPLPRFSSVANMTFIDLSNNDLSGPLNDLGVFSVQNVILDRNRFSGWMRPEWKRLGGSIISLLLNDNLITNDPLGDNQMSVIQSMSKLRFFSVANNQLSGPMPDDIFDGPDALEVFDISGNQFNGTIQYNQYYTLEYFYLQNIRIVSLSMIVDSMEQFDLSNNRFSGVLPFVFPPLYVEKINMSHNQFADYVPIRWKNMNQLTSLDLSHNSLFGSIRKTIGQFQSLKELYLDNNNLEGDIPDQIGGLSVSTLSLSNNQFTARSLSFLSSLTSLQHLNLSNNNIQAALPSSLSTQLITLDLSLNKIYGQIPEQFYVINTLNTVNMKGNFLTGSLKKFDSDPTVLDLSDNGLTGDVFFLTQLSYVSILRLNGNSFTGTLPSLVGRKNLQEVDLSNNQLVGQLPDFSDLLSLESVNLSRNSFSGNLPLFTGSTSLTKLDLSHNKIQYARDTLANVTLPSVLTCDMSQNQLRCPIGWTYRDKCGAQCSVQGEDTTDRLSYHMEGDLSTFDSNLFLNTLSSLGNITRSRLSVSDLRSGSVIASVEISPSTARLNEGSVEDTMNVLKGISTSVYNQSGIHLLDPVGYEPPSSSKTNIGAIIGGIVGGFVFLMIVFIILFIVYRNRMRRENDMKMFEMIDINQLNTDTTKKYLIRTEEITLMNKIGSGSFGVVYRAKWRKTDVAVKQIRADRVTQKKQLEDFIHEISIIQGLKSHLNIVAYIGVTIPPQSLSIITEYCSGGSLQRYLEKNPKCEMNTKIKFMKEIAQGMHHLHKEKVIHRDLASRNILLGENNVAKVTDFGLSRTQEDPDVVGETESYVGPIKWMAPEAITNKEYSTKSDVWSFGVVMWEIIEQCEPWKGIRAMRVAIDITANKKRLGISSKCPGPLAAIMTACWEEDPAHRPDFSKLMSELEQCGTDGEETQEIVSHLENTMTRTETGTGTGTEETATASYPAWLAINDSSAATGPYGRLQDMDRIINS
ncbi:putative leucine-rich repeat receptor-like protein kinase [Planoprotostelium fungivorum]|uniref:Putative leucine-rich repeat receptor-like protein kinase n=1 Tax=Planoprotostelium fungivorum TaxID=1890364 RepID=A0A2P6N1M0_9EUKA|nr:putative leucine-rich repeat receptor-like protein kinase [Planoprotostelium fungivorum]